MRGAGRPLIVVWWAVAALLLSVGAAGAQGQAGSPAARPLLTEAIDNTRLAPLRGNTRPEATAENDRGAVPDAFPLQHLLLQLQRPPEAEAALAALIAQQHDPASPNFHHWLTPAQLGAQFGLAPADLHKVTAWLESQGFRINQVYPNGTLIDFSGNAGQIRAAFHTRLHLLQVAGAWHFANMSDPQIPAALAPAVAGIVSLHDFRPKPKFAWHPQYTFGSNPTNYDVTPPDLATIYNLNPLFAAGISGQGQSIYVIEDSDLYSANDWTTFRQAFGLSSYTGSLATVHPAPSGGTACADPGVNSDDGEAILDAEYAGAAAPSATIVVASCANDGADGILLAIQNLTNSASPPAVVSISYGECEAENGAAANAAYNAAFQQGVAEGMSIFVSAGDEGAAACAGGVATQGIGVSAFASTAYVVAVGGSDFSDTYSGTNSVYWSSANSPSYGSAKSYIPEIPWNTTCASQLYATFEGFGTTYGSSGLCGRPNLDGLPALDSGSGGPSGCATGTPSVPGVVDGTCAGYAKPSWQSGVLGNPSDGVRDIPDVALFASLGPWNHAYVICWSDPRQARNGAAPCTGAPANWSTGFGGTSFSSPLMAGIQSLVNQHTGEKQGNPNPVYYAMAAAEYGAGGNSACNSSNGNAVASSCIFYDITLGDIDTPCSGVLDCYQPSGSVGVLSTSDNAYAPAYQAGTGWDFATGLGSVNAYNLVMNWGNANAGANTLSVSVSGSGSVISSPVGINCPGTCSAAFGTGISVSLTEIPVSGFGFSGWGGACSGVGTCTVVVNQAQSVTASFAQGTSASSPLVAAVLPESRSAVVDNAVSAFATIINSGSNAVAGCAIAPSSGLPLNFAYQTTDPATNALTGTANMPVTIAAGGSQSFVIGLTPTATFGPVEESFSFACNNIAPAPVDTGLNTLLLSSSATPVPDIVALAVTPSADGALRINGTTGTSNCSGCGLNSFAVATVNLGSAATITATAAANSVGMPLSLAICQTNPSTGVCVSGPGSQGASAVATIGANATPTFAIFAAASGDIPFQPQTNRIFVQFTDSSGTIRGATSVAVTAP